MPARSARRGIWTSVRVQAPGVHNFFYAKNCRHFGGWKAIDVLKKEYEKYGVHLLVTMTAGPATPCPDPVKTVADIKGTTGRVSGLMMNWFQKLGGQGVFIPGEDTYNALQTGAIDGASWGGAMGMWSMKFHEVAKYYFGPAVIPVACANVIVNKKVWDSMPKDIQKILENGFAMAGVEFTNHQNWTGEQWGLNKMKAAKVQISELKGADYEKGLQAAIEIWDEVAKKDAASAKLVAMQKDYMKQMGYLK
jgi:TRAP-type C4-dicarboxylate transport system substrate-binding protein